MRLESPCGDLDYQNSDTFVYFSVSRWKSESSQILFDLIVNQSYLFWDLTSHVKGIIKIL